MSVFGWKFDRKYIYSHYKISSMSTLLINNLAIRFGLTFLVVKSWIEHKNIRSSEEATVFFEENIDYIKAQPFVKWV